MSSHQLDFYFWGNTNQTGIPGWVCWTGSALTSQKTSLKACSNLLSNYLRAAKSVSSFKLLHKTPCLCGFPFVSLPKLNSHSQIGMSWCLDIGWVKCVSESFSIFDPFRVCFDVSFAYKIAHHPWGRTALNLPREFSFPEWINLDFMAFHFQSL